MTASASAPSPRPAWRAGFPLRAQRKGSWPCRTDEIGYPAFVKPTMSLRAWSGPGVPGPRAGYVRVDLRRAGMCVRLRVSPLSRKARLRPTEITLLTVPCDAASGTHDELLGAYGHRQEGWRLAAESWQPWVMSGPPRSAHWLRRRRCARRRPAARSPCLGPLSGAEFFVRGDVWFSEPSASSTTRGMGQRRTQAQS